MRFRTQVTLVTTLLVVGTSLVLGGVLISMSTGMLYRQLATTGGAFTRMLATQLEQKRELIERMAGPRRQPPRRFRLLERAPEAPPPPERQTESLRPLMGMPPPGSGDAPLENLGEPPRPTRESAQERMPRDPTFEEDLLELAEIANASAISFVEEGALAVTFTPKDGHGSELTEERIAALWKQVNDGTEQSLAFSDTKSSVAIMTMMNEKTTGPRRFALVVEFPKTMALHFVASRYWELVLTSCVVVIVAVATAWRMSRSISNPLSQLAATARAFGEGDLDEPAPVQGPAETRHLGEVLNSMATSQQLHIRDLKEETSRREQLESELRVAAALQKSLLPRPGLERFEGVELLGWSEAAKAVGGDFYDYRVLADGRLLFVIGDASGKGIPAALVAGKCLSMLQALSDDCSEPGPLLCRVNMLVAGQFREDGHFVTLFLGIFDPGTRRLCYTRAGHNPPILVRNGDGPPRVLGDQDGLPLAIRAHAHFETTEIELAPHDTLLLYTDGITEAMDENRRQFGQDKLVEVLLPNSSHPLPALMEALTYEVRQFGGVWPPEDDCTMLLLRVT